jgi:hypothetical protein
MSATGPGNASARLHRLRSRDPGRKLRDAADEKTAHTPGFRGLPRAYPEPTLFEGADYSLFHAFETLSQKASVGRHLLRRLVIKELVDSALDTGAECVSFHLIDPSRSSMMVPASRCHSCSIRLTSE